MKSPILKMRPRILVGIVASGMLSLNFGCASSTPTTTAKTRDYATTATTTATGAYIGVRETQDKAKGAAIGAAAGFVVGETINFLSNKSQREAYLAGYERGQSDAIKQQYWIARDNQRSRADDGYEEALYEVPIPAAERDGVLREPTTRVIRVVVPKQSP